MLLWINRPSRMVFDNRPAGARLVKGKRVAYMAHRVIDVDLTKVEIVRQAIKLDYERASPVRHKVRGAFHHSGGDVNHGHQWPLFPDGKGHWVCHGCGRKRWWVKDHVRGDSTKGMNIPEYSVNVAHE